MIKHSVWDIKSAVGCMTLELKREAQAEDINLRVVRKQVRFKALKLEEITREVCTEKSTKNCTLRCTNVMRGGGAEKELNWDP